MESTHQVENKRQHALSGKLSLGHACKGVGEERHIVVTKPTGKQVIDTDSTPMTSDIKPKKMVAKTQEELATNKCTINTSDGMAENNLADKENLNRSETEPDVVVLKDIGTKERKDGKIQCKICCKDVIKANIILHEIHCAKTQKTVTLDKNDDKKNKNISKSSKPRQFDKELAKKIKTIDDDDFDALLETVKSMDKACCHNKYKTSVQTLYDVCKYCAGRYCMSHHTPEVHGYGDAARNAARAQISKDGVLIRGSGTPNRKPDDAKKAHLQRRLDSKMTDMAAKRKSKPKK